MAETQQAKGFPGAEFSAPWEARDGNLKVTEIGKQLLAAGPGLGWKKPSFAESGVSGDPRARLEPAATDGSNESP